MPGLASGIDGLPGGRLSDRRPGVRPYTKTGSFSVRKRIWEQSPSYIQPDFRPAGAGGISQKRADNLPTGKDINRRRHHHFLSPKFFNVKKRLIACGAAACLLLTFLAGSALAQSTAPASAKLPTCAEAVKAATADLQAKANAQCRTVHQCVECEEMSKQTCKPVTANPTCKGSATVSTKTSAAPSTKNGGVPAPADPFEVVVMQSICFAGGVTLEAYVTGQESKPVKERQSGYKFSWRLDGVSKEGARLECVKGKEAVLVVTQAATNKSVTKNVMLPNAGGGNESARVPAPGAGGINEGEVVVAFSKTSCFGSCPVYTVKFYSNGTASWDGYMNVERMGHFEQTLGPEVLTKLQEKAFKVKFFDFASKYPTEFTVVDAPSTVTYVKMGGKEKQVENIMESPAALVEFENYIYDEIVKLGWKADPPKKTMPATAAPGAAPKQ